MYKGWRLAVVIPAHNEERHIGGVINAIPSFVDHLIVVDDSSRDRTAEMARETRGLNFTTAGSINNGSRLTGMRLLMAAVERYGRYD